MTEPKKRPWFLDYDARDGRCYHFLSRLFTFRLVGSGVGGDSTNGSTLVVAHDAAAPAATTDFYPFSFLGA